MATDIGQLKTSIATLLNNEVSYFVQGGHDMILFELNEARRNAEMLYDFANNQALFDLTVDSDNGARLSDATLSADMPAWMTGCQLKSVETFYQLAEDGEGLVPLYHLDKKSAAVQMKNKRRKRSLLNPRYRYPTDATAEAMAGNGQLQVMLNGDLVELLPKQDEDLDLVLDGHIWMPDYTADEDVDWMVTYGSEYLKWKVIDALNYFTRSFNTQQDSLRSPAAKAGDALVALQIWDSANRYQGQQLTKNKV